MHFGEKTILDKCWLDFRNGGVSLRIKCLRGRVHALLPSLVTVEWTGTSLCSSC